jgi:hypothetical protein
MNITFDLVQLQKPIQLAIADFQHHADVNHLLDDVRTALINFIEQLILAVLQQFLYDQKSLATLKIVAAKSALRFNGYKPTSIRLLSGQCLSIESPYFARAKPPKRPGRKSKKRNAKSGCHLGLSYLGLIGRCSTLLASAAVQAALLCPSFEIAKRTLQSYGIALNVKTIQRLCFDMGNKALKHRHEIVLCNADSVENRTLFVCMDGGRLRERRAKRGRRPAGQKRQGYHTDWREPTQLVIQWLNSDTGDKCKETLPLYDATLADTDDVFKLLEDYLCQLNISKADMVIFCADGARKYWKRFSLLARKLKVNAHLEIIDYTHAKQNLHEVLDKLPKNLGTKEIDTIAANWKNMLWQGKLGEIHYQIRRLIKSPKKRKQALNKFKNYFLDNFRRMQYAAFRQLDLPTGSGCVESAIRRVINLRLKSPGIFWKRQTAEVMLFLRSTLLCGRWNIMLKNLMTLNRGELAQCH